LREHCLSPDADIVVTLHQARAQPKMAAPVEKFTISIVPADARHGTLVLEWGTFRWTAPIVVI
jgi:hypothetical protein